jgi:hypothetical protein
VNGWKGTHLQTERTSNGLIRKYGYSDGKGVNVLFAMSQFSSVFYLLNVFKKMQVLTLKKSHLQVKRSQEIPVHQRSATGYQHYGDQAV